MAARDRQRSQPRGWCCSRASVRPRLDREVLLTRDATAINGREEIRLVLAQLIARRPLFQIEPYSLLSLGDLVLARERWTMHFQIEGAAPLREATNATLLLRQVDSRWKLALLAPWGRP